jgi:RimJ/RimL family protein N-acetyltransferase
MGSIDTFCTPRLVGTRLQPADFADCCRMNQNEQVRATLGGVLTDQQTRAWLDFNLAHWERYGFGVCFVRDPRDGAFIGRAGLRHADVEGMLDEIEVLYALMPEHWGRGLATEAACECLRIGFELLGLKEIVGFTLPTNFGSRRVLEKSGLTYERNIIHADLPHVLFRIRRDDWRPGSGVFGGNP